MSVIYSNIFARWVYIVAAYQYVHLLYFYLHTILSSAYIYYICF